MRRLLALLFWRLPVLLLALLLALQLAFALRIAGMALVPPSSTAFQRAQLWQLAAQGQWHWNQEPVAPKAISNHLRRAVIASEDGRFMQHGGVEWDAIQQARQRNAKAQAKAEAKAKKQGKDPEQAEAKIVGGSTISQQLAKNLFLSGERSVARKGQELVLTYMLEAMLGKEKILNTYLNNVEWGQGIFGAQAAAQYYFKTDASGLSAAQAARLAVMLPAPKRFEKNPSSPYLMRRSRVIQKWMQGVQWPDAQTAQPKSSETPNKSKNKSKK